MICAVFLLSGWPLKWEDSLERPLRFASAQSYCSMHSEGSWRRLCQQSECRNSKQCPAFSSQRSAHRPDFSKFWWDFRSVWPHPPPQPHPHQIYMKHFQGLRSPKSKYSTHSKLLLLLQLLSFAVLCLSQGLVWAFHTPASAGELLPTATSPQACSKLFLFCFFKGVLMKKVLEFLKTTTAVTLTSYICWD